ncbi:hypothetical protein HHI36_004393 [Cryptolaemus montrouzieri]|uniref:Uncharacterized protein n=1 Tax=Cryptolaemus montrouzieri TaxID=559131 RepID=A0ABD2NR84_9CUCU
MFRTRVLKMLGKRFGNSSVCMCNQSALNFEDIPSPKGLPFIGTRLAVWIAGSSKNLHEYVDKRHKELGPIYREQLGPITGTFVAEPDAIRSIFAQEGKYPVHIIPQAWVFFNEKYKFSRGLLFMNGPEWQEHRRIMNKFLLRGNLRWIEDACDLVIENFITKLKKNNEVLENLENELYRTFLDVLVSVLMGSESYSKNNQVLEQLVEYLSVHVSSVFETTSKLQMITVDLAAKLRLPQWSHFETSMKNALFGANKLVDALALHCGNTNGLLRKMQEENISKDQIKAIVADLILAASDTTAYTMQWILYSIAKNLGVQERIRSEYGSPDSNYTRHVLKETLRLYPVAPFITRYLPHESRIAGYKIPSNSLIVMSIYTTGRDEKYFKNALSFQPERWERSNEQMAMQQASLPFAIGSRSCIGRKLAEYELQKMLTEIVGNFSIELCNTKEVKMALKMIAVPSEPIRLKLTKIS